MMNEKVASMAFLMNQKRTSKVVNSLTHLIGTMKKDEILAVGDYMDKGSFIPNECNLRDEDERIRADHSKYLAR